MEFVLNILMNFVFGYNIISSDFNIFIVQFTILIYNQTNMNVSIVKQGHKVTRYEIA